MAKHAKQRREQTTRSAHLSGSERLGWWLLAPLLLTPGALAWVPADAIFGRWGSTAKAVAVVYFALIAAGGFVLRRVSKRR